MKRREDNRPLITRALHIIAKGLIIMALGMSLSSLLGDIGLSARALGVLGALAVGGAAVAVSEYASSTEKHRCEEERRAIALEDRRVDAFVAEQVATPPLYDLADDPSPEWGSRFVRHLDEQRRQQPSWKRVN